MAYRITSDKKASEESDFRQPPEAKDETLTDYLSRLDEELITFRKNINKKLHSDPGELSGLFTVLFEYGQEGGLRNHYRTDHLHPLLALSLFFQELPFSSNIPAVTLRRNVLTVS